MSGALSTQPLRLGRLRSRLGTEQGFGTFLRTVRVHTVRGSAGEAARIGAAILAMAGVGEVRIGPGTALADSVIDLSTVQSGVVIAMHPNTTMLASLTPTGGPGGFAQSVIYANQLGVVGKNDGSLQTACAKGDTSIICNFAAGQDVPAVGDTIAFGNNTNNTIQISRVLQVTGSGPYTLRIDDRVQFDIATAGSVVGCRTVPTGIKIYGNGARFTGTGDRAIELAAAWRGLVEDVKIGRSGGNVFEAFGMSWDIACRESWGKRIEVDGGKGDVATPTHVGLGLESTIDCGYEDSYVHDGGASGADCAFYFGSPRQTSLRNCRATNWWYGLELNSSGGTDTASAQRCEISGFVAEGCVTAGVIVADGALDVLFSNLRIAKSASHGLLISGTTAQDRIVFSGVDVSDCVGDGVRVTGSGYANITGLVTKGCAHGVSIQGAGEALITGWKDKDSLSTGSALIYASTGVVQIDNFRWTEGINGVMGFITDAGSTGELSLSNGRVACSPTGGAFLDAQAGTPSVFIGNVKVTSGQFGIYAAHANAIKLTLGPNVDLSATTTPLTFDGSTVVTPFDATPGTGSPEGVVYAPIGSTYRRKDGGATTSLYVKTANGASVNTGWTGK